MKVKGAAALGQGEAGGADREEPGGALDGGLAGWNTLFMGIIPRVGKVAAGEALPSECVEGVAAFVDVVAAPVVELPWPALMTLDGQTLMKVGILVARSEKPIDVPISFIILAGIGVTLVRKDSQSISFACSQKSIEPWVEKERGGDRYIYFG